MLGFVLHHWKLGGLGLVVVAALVAFLLPGGLAFLRSLFGLVLGAARGAVEWLRKPHDWWRIWCLSMAFLCAYLVVLTGNVRKERDVAVRELASVQTTIQTVRQEGAANVKAAQAQCRADNAEAVAKAQAHARDVESKLAAAMAELAAKNAREKADAKRNGDAVAAGLRAGTVQLRDEWAQVRPAPFDVPGLTDGPGGPDDAADLRAAGAGRLVEIGDSCDADIRYWQDLWRTVSPAK